MRPRRRAFTMLEVLMFSFVGSIVLYITYNIMVGTNRQGINLDTKLKAVQGAQMLLERLERDLKHMVYEEGRYELQVSPAGDWIRFYIFDGHGADLTSGEIPIHLREYRFEEGSSRVSIDGAPFANWFFRAVEFSLSEAAGGKPGERPVLTMRVGGVADDRAGLPEDRQDLKTRADFVSAVGLSAVASAKRSPYWRSSLRYRLQ